MHIFNLYVCNIILGGISMKDAKKNDWLLWVLLILLTPIGIVYMWLIKKDFTSKKKKILSIVFGVWFVIVLINGNNGTENNEPVDVVNTEATKEPISEFTKKPTKEIEPTPEPTPEYDVKEIKKLYSSEDVIGKSAKDIDKVDDDILLDKTVINDSNDNLRLARITYRGSLEEYIMSYYEKYFSSDDEIHYIVNFTTKTTTCIANMGSFLSVTITEYVDKEEHDASTLGSGMVYGQYYIYFGTNDIEKIQ